MTTEIKLQGMNGEKFSRFMARSGIRVPEDSKEFVVGSFPDVAGKYMTDIELSKDPKKETENLSINLRFIAGNHDGLNRFVGIRSNATFFRGAPGRRGERLVSVNAEGDGSQHIGKGIKIIVHTDAAKDIFVAEKSKTDE